MTFPRFSRIMFLSLFLVLFLGAQEVSLSDYRIRQSQYSLTRVGVSGNLGTSRSGSVTSGTDASSNSDVSGSLWRTMFVQSEERIWQYTVNIQGETNSRHHKSDAVAPFTSSESKNDRTGFDLMAVGGNRSYLEPGTWFINTNMSLYGGYALNHNESTYGTNPKNMGYTKTVSKGGEISAGIGYGIVRNAQMVIRVLRIMENLQEDGVLSRALTSEEVTEMAELLDAEFTASAKHERSMKYDLKTVMDALIQKGIIAPGASAGYETGRTVEVLQQSLFPRYTGWSIQTGPLVNYFDLINASNYQVRMLEKNNKVQWKVATEYGYPISLRMHLYTTATVFHDLYKASGPLGYNVNGTLSHEIGERSVAELTLAANNTLDFESTPLQYNILTVGYNTSARLAYHYFLEDQLYFSIAGSYNDYSTTTRNTPNRYTSGSTHFEFGINYRLF